MGSAAPVDTVMTKVSPPAGGWDAAGYEQSFGFIARYGASLIDLLAPQPGERILDLGCGTGRLTAELAERGAEAIGLDRDPAMIARARAAYPALDFVCANGESFRLDRPVDAILSNAALHWMTRPQRAITAMARALRPGGRLVLEMGGQGNVATVVEAVTEALVAAGVAPDAIPNPWYFPSIGLYCSRLERGGFDVAEAALFDRPTPLDDLDGGLAEWLAMFVGPFLSPLPEARRPAVIADAVARAAPKLKREGRWVVDYRRLRIVARRSG